MSTVFNIAKDRLGTYFLDAAGTPDIQAILLKSAGLQVDATLADYTTLSALLAASNDEADFTGSAYTRKTLAAPTRTVDNTNDRVLLGGAAVGTQLAITWGTAGGTTSNQLGKMLLVYVPVPGTSTDAQIVPLVAHDISATTDGNDLVVTLHADGSVRVRNP